MDSQTIFAILVGAALACFSLVMVGYSFFRGNEAMPGAAFADDGSSDERVGLDAIYDSIDTLELEHQLGNIPDDQYRDQLQAYRMQAATTIRMQLETGNAAPEIVLEHEVLAARDDMRSSWKPCPQCDAPLPETVHGSSETTCPHCGAELDVSSGNPVNGVPASEGENQAQVR